MHYSSYYIRFSLIGSVSPLGFNIVNIWQEHWLTSERKVRTSQSLSSVLPNTRTLNLALHAAGPLLAVVHTQQWNGQAVSFVG